MSANLTLHSTAGGTNNTVKGGIPLTALEMDTNFINLDNEIDSKAPIASPALTGNVTVTSNSASPALMVTQDGSGNVIEVRDVAGDGTPFVVDANGAVRINNSPATTVVPTASSFNTLGSLIVSGTTGSATTREFMASIGMLSNTGSGASSIDKDKVTLYSGIRAQNGTGNIWAFNPTVLMDAGSAVAYNYDARGIEVSFTNNAGDRGNTAGQAGLATPVAYGISILGAGTNRSTSGMVVGGSDNAWNRGLTFSGNSIVQASIADYSSSTISLDVQGQHVYAVSLGGTLTADGANNAVGVFSKPTYSTTVTGTGYSFHSAPTGPSSGTQSSIAHFSAANLVKGASASITNQYGFLAADMPKTATTGATNNYGFYSSIVNASGTNWAFYGAGNAPSYFGGAVTIVGQTTLASTTASSLSVSGATTLASTSTATLSANGQSLTVQPTANAFNTLSSLSAQATTTSESTREFVGNFGLISNKGWQVGTTGQPNYQPAAPWNRDKVALYAGVQAQAGTGDVWAFNPVTVLDANSAPNYQYNGYIIEADLNNNVADRGNADGPAGLTSPVVYGVAVTGAGVYKSTSGLIVTGVNPNTGGPIWNRGLTFALDSIDQASIADYSNSDIQVDIRGSHQKGISYTGELLSDVGNNSYMIVNQATLKAPNISSSVYSAPQTATSGVYASVQHFYASNVTKNGTASVTAQYGFMVGDLTSAPQGQNFGFYSSVSGQNWAFYGAGNAPSRFGGAVTVVGQTTLAAASATSLSVSGAVTLSGTSTALTPTVGTNNTTIATTAFVQTAISNVINSAPAALDTLNELAAALGNDSNFASTVTNSLALKAPLASPSFTGVPVAPTAAAGTNTTQIATTAFVQTANQTLLDSAMAMSIALG